MLRGERLRVLRITRAVGDIEAGGLQHAFALARVQLRPGGEGDGHDFTLHHDACRPQFVCLGECVAEFVIELGQLQFGVGQPCPGLGPCRAGLGGGAVAVEGGLPRGLGVGATVGLGELLPTVDAAQPVQVFAVGGRVQVYRAVGGGLGDGPGAGAGFLAFAGPVLEENLCLVVGHAGKCHPAACVSQHEHE